MNPGQTSIPFELSSLAKARRYQGWMRDTVWPHLGNRILELGSGIGNLSQHLPVREKLILTDIEPALLAILADRFSGQPGIEVRPLTVESSLTRTFTDADLDTIVSFNVLEHVSDDTALLRDAIELLRQSKAPGPKRLVSWVPAHSWAYGEMDREFGHVRRYSDRSFRQTLRRAGATDLKRNYESRYINLPGLLGWYWTGRVKRKRAIGENSIQAFERICPVVKPVDNFLHRWLRIPFGNSLVAVYRVL
jgi:SAM-dependent methyltransferase